MSVIFHFLGGGWNPIQLNEASIVQTGHEEGCVQTEVGVLVGSSILMILTFFCVCEVGSSALSQKQVYVSVLDMSLETVAMTSESRLTTMY